jgi:hypothetical protein
MCARNLITGLTSSASPRVDLSSTCKVGQKLGVSLPLLTCSPSAWPSRLLYRRGRKSRRDLRISLYLLLTVDNLTKTDGDYIFWHCQWLLIHQIFYFSYHEYKGIKNWVNIFSVTEYPGQIQPWRTPAHQCRESVSESPTWWVYVFLIHEMKFILQGFGPWFSMIIFLILFHITFSNLQLRSGLLKTDISR